MKRCIVCSAPLTPNLEACPQCRTGREALHHLETVASRKRFFFGSAKPSAAADPEPKRRARVRSHTGATGVASAAQPPTKAIVPATDFSQLNQPDENDLIHNRDVVAPEPPPAAMALKWHGMAYLVDLFLCLFLDFWVFKFILWLSPRSIKPLLDFSLIPLFFVLLCFTVLYFWLFLGLFKKTCGHLLIERFAHKYAE